MKKTLLVLGWLFLFNTSSATGERVLPGLNEISGNTNNYKITDSDGLADFSLVIPAMNSEELGNFDMGRIFSPESDTIKILTFSLALPSNLSVPKQTESYFVSFTVEKNLYRTYLPDGNYNMYAVRGQFPVKDVIKGVQGKKTLFELVNLFSFYGGGTKNVKASSNANADINVDDIKFDQKVTLKAPTYASGKVILALSLVKMKGEYYPTDVKRIPSGQSASLVTRAGADQYTISILLNDDQRAFSDGFTWDLLESIMNSRATTDFSQLTYAIQKVGDTPELLPQVKAPTFNKAQSTVSATPPSTVGSVNPAGTYIVLSETEAGTGIVPVSFKRKIWSMNVSGWQSSFSIPANIMAQINSRTTSYSWEVLYLGSDGSLPGTGWDAVTHVTRNALIF